MEKIKIEYLPIEKVKPYLRNPRKNDKAVDIVEKSIKEFKFRNPIVLDKNNEIVAGHTRLKAAIKLKYKEVPTIKITDLTEDQIKAFRIMDNKSQEYADWDNDILADEFNALEDTDNFRDTGFTNKEITDIWELVEKEESIKPELEFTEELLESHNYIVMYFDNQMDWQVAKELFKIKSKKAISSRPGMTKTGVGRVIKGSDVLKKING